MTNLANATPVVWILQSHEKREKDLTSCRGYGRIVEVLAADEQPSKNPQQCMDHLRERMQDACDDDYFLFTGGDPMTPFCAGIVLAELGLTHIKWLRWDRRTDGSGKRIPNDGYYTPVELFVEPMDYDDEAEVELKTPPMKETDD